MSQASPLLIIVVFLTLVWNGALVVFGYEWMNFNSWVSLTISSAFASWLLVFKPIFEVAPKDEKEE